MKHILGIIAGGGTFPCTVARTAKARGLQVIGVGFPTDTAAEFPALCDAFAWIKLGQLGKLIDFFHHHDVDHVVMAGPINKPKALTLRPDWRAAKLLFTLPSKGDDVVLRAVSRELEREGMPVQAAHAFTPELTLQPGVLTERKPTEQERADIAHGWKILDALGPLDIGQCIAIREGIVLAVEAVEGTDATILRAGEFGGPGAVIVKRPKSGQDRRLDLPAVGLKTLRSMHAAKASCLALEAGGCLFFDREDSLRFADTHNLSIVGWS